MKTIKERPGNTRPKDPCKQNFELVLMFFKVHCTVHIHYFLWSKNCANPSRSNHTLILLVINIELPPMKFLMILGLSGKIASH